MTSKHYACSLTLSVSVLLITQISKLAADSAFVQHARSCMHAPAAEAEQTLVLPHIQHLKSYTVILSTHAFGAH